MNVRTLADFKRFLALPGATVQVTQHDWVKPEHAKPGFFEPRQVKKLQTNAVQFTTGSWLQFGKASEYRFSGDTVVIALDQLAPDPFAHTMTYKLSIQEAA